MNDDLTVLIAVAGGTGHSARSERRAVGAARQRLPRTVPPGPLARQRICTWRASVFKPPCALHAPVGALSPVSYPVWRTRGRRIAAPFLTAPRPPRASTGIGLCSWMAWLPSTSRAANPSAMLRLVCFQTSRLPRLARLAGGRTTPFSRLTLRAPAAPATPRPAPRERRRPPN